MDVRWTSKSKVDMKDRTLTSASWDSRPVEHAEESNDLDWDCRICLRARDAVFDG